MLKKSILVMATLSLLGLSSCSHPTSKESDFKYLLDEFADAKVMRYRVDGFENLSLQQKEYIYHLSEAGKWGRDIIFDQNFKYNLPIRKAIEAIIEKNQNDETLQQDSEYQKFISYAKRVFFSNGIHHHYSEEKFYPECSQDFFKKLMVDAGLEKQAEELIDVIYNTKRYAHRKYFGDKEDLLLASCVNFYEGVNRKEAENFYAKMIDPNDTTPISYGLNSKLVKKGNKVYEEVYKIGGLYGAALSKVVEHLNKAKEVAENETQKKYIDQLIAYYHSGDLRTWDEYNITWAGETEGVVDFVNGFIEDYGDPLGMKATWESVVNFKDMEASERTQKISEQAQWFENHSPVAPQFKKKEVKGVSAKVINVVSLSGDCYPTAPLGINLPNADWIRKNHGSKSVTIGNITDAYNKAALESPKSMLQEFAYDEKEIEFIKKYGDITNTLHTDLHECLGHGSGQLLEGTSSAALLENSSALEEARADLFALYYVADPKMIELGLLDNKDAYQAEYLSYIKNGMLTQFVRIELGKPVTQAHMRARKLIAEWSYDHGKAENVIEKKVKDGKTYMVVNDYTKLRGLFGELLAEIQRIKSEGDYQAGKNLIDTYAVNIDPELHKEVLERYKSLELKPYGGFINPEIIAVEENGQVVDYKINYVDDYLQQMMEYGKNYSAL